MKIAKLDMEPDEFIESARAQAIARWIERWWPTGPEDSNACRYCRVRYKTTTEVTGLIPVGYGKRPKLWMHWACYGPYWAGERLRALRETGWDWD